MRTAFLAAACVLALTGLGAPAKAADPWETPMDAGLAMRDPDRFAWQMFIALTWPADEDSRMPASNQPYGAPGPVMFETWALSDQVYLDKGAEPPAWDEIPWSGARNLSRDSLPRQLALVRKEDAIAPGKAGHQQEEVRMNRAAFDYVRGNELYSIEGQQWFFYNRQPVAFPTGAIEVKAIWRPISEEDKARYQWTTMRDAKTGRQYSYGLTALHIASKVLPNWFWATFEHVDNPYRSGIHDEGWLVPSRDSVACPPGFLDCNRAPTGFGLESTRWANYRLRGTQVDYIDRDGNPVILGNSHIETGFQQSSSCMSCHARATIGPSRNEAAGFTFSKGNDAHPPAAPEAMRLPVFDIREDGRILSFNGVPPQGWLALPGQAAGASGRYQPLDFVWSMIEAKSNGGK